jgi:hypothetical protein
MHASPSAIAAIDQFERNLNRKLRAIALYHGMLFAAQEIFWTWHRFEFPLA